MAADVYIEGFPFGSQTAMLEPAMLGIPPVPAFNPNSELFVTNDLALSNLIESPKDEQEYIARASSLIADEELRKETGEKIVQLMKSCHFGETWHRCLD